MGAYTQNEVLTMCFKPKNTSVYALKLGKNTVFYTVKK